MKLIDCEEPRHAAAILDILNEAIVNSTAIYDYAPRPAASMPAWFAAKRAGDYPVLGVESDRGELLGFASYGRFRPHAAYKYSVEHSVYVHHEHRGRGIGARLLAALIERARAQDLHLLVGGLDAANAASIALHVKLGFTHAGTIAQAGYKFGRWLDLAFYQRVLDTPRQPSAVP
jgi:phosphinothricin acetyltransferase